MKGLTESTESGETKASGDVNLHHVLPKLKYLNNFWLDSDEMF